MATLADYATGLQSCRMKTIIDIESDPQTALALSPLFSLDYRVLHCPGRDGALEAARKHEASAYILDLDLESDDPFDLLEGLGRLGNLSPVLALTARGDPRRVVRAIRMGAVDVLPKPARPPDIRDILTKCMLRHDERELFFLGDSAAIAEIRRQIEVCAQWDFPILITGESGTGKELAARSIHELSKRRERAHVARNCATLPSALIESELFGSSRGAFTGASDRPGAFELADGGTLFLDEIGDASPETQAKLLRALESGSIWRLGARQAVKVDVRFVSATSRNLEAAMAEGSFRPDLFYRVETLRISIPPLRERPEDIEPIARHFIRDAAHGCKDIAAAAIERLACYAWPGNVRQLRNAIQRAVVLSGGRETIRVEDIVL